MATDNFRITHFVCLVGSEKVATCKIASASQLNRVDYDEEGTKVFMKTVLFTKQAALSIQD